MKCQYCDSIIKNVPDNGICPNCGGVIGKKEHIVMLAPPDWAHKDASGRIAFDKDSVQFYADFWSDNQDVLVPYDEVIEVTYKPATEWKKGFLAVRGKQNRYKPIPQTTLDAIKDDTAIAFTEKHNEKFLYAYRFLKQYADKNADK